MATAAAATLSGAAASLPPLRAYRGVMFVWRAECAEIVGYEHR
jgi:hypothetical protein